MSSWHHTGRSAKFLWVLSPSSAFPLIIFGLHMRAWTFKLAVAGCVVFGLLSWKGWTLKWMRRRLLRLIVGTVRNPRPWWFRERFKNRFF